MKGNLPHKFNKKIYLFPLIIILSVLNVKANNSIDNIAIPIYNSENSETVNKTSLKNLMKSYDFKTSAEISLRKKNIKSPTSNFSLPLDWSYEKKEENTILNNNEYIKKNSALSDDSSLNISLPNLNDSDKSLIDFDELWIDYQVKNNDVPCILESRFKINRTLWNKNYYGKLYEEIIFRNYQARLKPIEIINHDNFVDLEYIKGRSIFHLFKKRYISLKENTSSNKIRYVIDDEITVVKQEMKFEISEHSKLTLYSLNTNQIKALNVRVNLGGIEDRIVSVKVPKNTNLKTDFEIGKALKNKFRERITTNQNDIDKKIYLKEIYFHFQDLDINHLLTRQTLKFLTLRNEIIEPLVQTQDVPISYITSSEKKIGKESWRKIIDLTNLIEGASEISLDTSKLIIKKPPLRKNCGIKINSINLVSTKKNKEFYINSFLDQNKKKYYSHDLNISNKQNSNETIKFLAYSAPINFYQSTSFRDFKRKLNSKPDIELNTLGLSKSDPVFRSIDGLYLASDSEIKSAITHEYMDGVQIKGNGSNLNIIWPKLIKIDKKSIFKLNLNSHSDIRNILLTITGKNGKSWQKYINHNEAIYLDTAPENITSTKITINFLEPEFHFILHDLFFTTLGKLDNKVYSQKVPLKHKQALKLKSVSEGIIKVSEGIKKSDKTRSRSKSFWSDNIDNGWLEFIVKTQILWTEKIIVHYQLPIAWLKSKQCILKADFVFPHKTFNKSFCLNKNIGTATFSVKELGLMNQKNLKKIIWYVSKPKGESGNVKIETSINSWGISSLEDLIISEPIFYLDNNSYFMSNEDLQTIINSGKYINLPQSVLSDFINNEVFFRVGINPWFKLDKIILKPTSEINLKNLFSSLKSEELSKDFYSKIIIGVIFLLSLFFATVKSIRLNIKYIFSNINKITNLKFIQILNLINKNNIKLLNNRFVLIFWILFGGILYILGIYTFSNSSENYFITFAGMIILLIWRELLIFFRPFFLPLYPKLFKKVYAGSGMHYIFGFFVFLFLALVMLILKLEHFAEHFALIAYYMIIVAVVLKIIAINNLKIKLIKKKK